MNASLSNMKKGLLIISTVLFLLACQEENKQITSDFIHFPPSSGSQSGEKVPVIAFDSTTINFGTLAIGETFDHTFRFVNKGNAPLSIGQVSPSCGCTIPRNWTKEPIAPGASGEISVTFNSKGNSGAVEKSISVLTNCIPAATRLLIKGQVIGVDIKEEKKAPIEMEMSSH